MDCGIIKITEEQLLLMEHDFLREELLKAKERCEKDSCDEFVAAMDFMNTATVIGRFVDELIGD